MDGRPTRLGPPEGMERRGSHAVTGALLQPASRLSVLQFSKDDTIGRQRQITRKELLDECNSQAWLQSPALLATPPSPHRQASSVTQQQLLRARDLRKIDPAFASRLEPAIIIRSGCIILSLGRTELRALITRDHMYIVLREGQESLVSHVHSNLASLLAAAERESQETLDRAMRFSGDPSEVMGMPSISLGEALATMPHEEQEEKGLYRPVQLEEGILASASLSAAAAIHTPSPASASQIIIPDTKETAGPTEGSVRQMRRTQSHGSLPALQWPSSSEKAAAAAAAAASTGGPAFEFCAVEAVLMTASAELSRRQRELTESLQRALHALRRNVVGATSSAGARQLDRVRQLKQSVRELLVMSQALEEALREVLDDDDDLEAMYLTRRALLHRAAEHTGALQGAGSEHDHEEAEMLLESYLQEIGATVSELEVLTYNIDGTEKFVSFRLDSARNRLLKVDVIATASATALGVGQLVSGIFGMNLPSSLFDPEFAGDNATFIGVAAATVGVVVILITFLLLCFYSPLSAWLSLCGCHRGGAGAVLDEHLQVASQPILRPRGSSGDAATAAAAHPTLSRSIGNATAQTTGNGAGPGSEGDSTART